MTLSKQKDRAFDKVWYNQFREELVQELLDVTAKKNNDYTTGSGDDAMQMNPFANFDRSTEYGVQPIVGLCIRMQDKFQRSMTFAKDGKLAIDEGNDSVRDIFFDLAGYCLLAMGMLERDKHTKE
tara:strand:- start:9594 stop:9968 length:375 start_codon:yes stop_codon:yes gene_type:complete